jgi:hypothetical protein
MIIMFTWDRWVYMRGFVMDGNFSAEHMAMRNPEDDVSLSDGTAFMVSMADYKAHLAVASEDRQVCPGALYMSRCTTEHSARNPNAITIRPSTRLMPTGGTLRLPA